MSENLEADVVRLFSQKRKKNS